MIVSDDAVFFFFFFFVFTYPSPLCFLFIHSFIWIRFMANSGGMNMIIFPFFFSSLFSIFFASSVVCKLLTIKFKHLQCTHSLTHSLVHSLIHSLTKFTVCGSCLKIFIFLQLQNAFSGCVINLSLSYRIALRRMSY